jgi:hypothetical protein
MSEVNFFSRDNIYVAVDFYFSKKVTVKLQLMVGTDRQEEEKSS